METPQERSRYDSGAMRKSVRYGRETGIRLFIPAAELRKAGIDPHGDPPRYKVWGTSGGGAMIRFYA